MNFQTNSKFAVLVSSASLLCVCGLAQAQWTHFVEYGDGSLLLLASVGSTAKGCEGKKRATMQRKVLSEWKIVQELCYEIEKSGDIKIKDPEKYLWNNTLTLKAQDFRSVRDEQQAQTDRLDRQREEEMQQWRLQNQRILRQQTPKTTTTLIDGRTVTCTEQNGIASCM
jgi:hypothetical protein